MTKVVIVGGVAGGATAAARMRRLEENAEIILFERGEHISFANCGLPYYIGDVIPDMEYLLLQTPESFNQRFHVDVRVRHEVTAVHPIGKTITVKNLDTGESFEESYDKLILAPGAKPRIPNIPGVDLPHVFALRNIGDMNKIKDYMTCQQPKHAVLVGGGAIGIEMAENLHNAGIHTTIVEMSNHIMNILDDEMSCEITSHIRSKGVDIVLGTAVYSIEEHSVTTGSGTVIPADLVILSTGVQPDTGFLQGSPIHLNNKGAIIVNQRLHTNMPGVYAVGDAVAIEHFITGQESYIPLAGPANKEGRIVANNIFGFMQSRYKGTQGTSIVKCFDMTAASTGISERTAREAGVQYEKSYTISPSHAGYYPGASALTIKLIFDKVFNRILGAQVVGYEGVDKRCDVLATAIRAGLTIQELTTLELAYAPPYSSAKDPVNIAGFVACNIARELVDVYHLEDIEHINPETDLLLDVRTPKEFAAGAIPGAINIPVDDLRDRLGELPQDKTIYVYCRIGYRGYIACRILTGNGIKCRNLSGGYVMYDRVAGEMPELLRPKYES